MPSLLVLIDGVMELGWPMSGMKGSTFAMMFAGSTGCDRDPHGPKTFVFRELEGLDSKLRSTRFRSATVDFHREDRGATAADARSVPE